MNRNDIFEMEHSNNTLKLTPLKDLNNKEFEDLISSYNLDINKFYEVEGKLHPYCYINGTAYVEVYGMTKEAFEMFSIKDRINQSIKMHEECIKNKDFDRLFMIIDKPFRLEWYKKLFDQIPDNKKHKVFKRIYSSSEYGFNNLDRDFIKEIFKNSNVDKSMFENDEIITIYRGESSKSTPYTDAYSWTTELETAIWFANRFDSDGKVYCGHVKVNDILDCYENNECEVIVLPENVFDVERFK